MTRWEYLFVGYSETRSQPAHPTKLGKTVWQWEQKYEVRRPGTEKPEVVGKSVHTWDPDSPPGEFGTLEEGTKIYELLNALGAEGWELVTETVRSTAVSNENGYSAAGRPLQTSYILKRCIG